jgi:hypothetical protein
VRNVARIKLGYYPLPQEAGKRLRRLLDFSAGSASVVDPCVGTGTALHIRCYAYLSASLQSNHQDLTEGKSRSHHTHKRQFPVTEMQ